MFSLGPPTVVTDIFRAIRQFTEHSTYLEDITIVGTADTALEKICDVMHSELKHTRSAVLDSVIHKYHFTKSDSSPAALKVSFG